MSRKAFLYRLYPSRTQARLLDATLETCRFFYNDCLAERKTAYDERGETIGKYEQLRQVKERKATNPYAKNVHSMFCRRWYKTSIKPSMRSFAV